MLLLLLLIVCNVAGHGFSHEHVLFQFEPTLFVDGLLGVGKAFGGTSKNEAEELASRLAAMRKERDAAKPNKAASQIMMSEDTLVTSDFVTAGGSGGDNNNKSKKKKKKKKK